MTNQDIHVKTGEGNAGSIHTHTHSKAGRVHSRAIAMLYVPVMAQNSSVAQEKLSNGEVLHPIWQNGNLESEMTHFGFSSVQNVLKALSHMWTCIVTYVAYGWLFLGTQKY